MIYYLVLCLFVVEYMRPGNLYPALNAARLNSILPWVCVLASAVKGVVPHRDIFEDRNFTLFGVFTFLVMVSVLTARVTVYAFTTFTIVFGYVLFLWIVARQMGTLDAMKGLFRTLIFIHAGIVFIAPQIVLDGQNRNYIPAGAFLGDGNDFSLSICILVPFCLFLLLDSNRKIARLFYALLLLLLVAAVIGTQSRGGTLGLIAVGVYYWLKTNRKVVTGALAAVAVVGVMALASPQYFQRMGTLTNVEDDGSAQGRLTAWRAGTAMMLSNPLLGVGAGNFPPNYTRFAPGAEGMGRWKTAHSIYFLALGELGLPGIGVLLYFIFWNLHANRKAAKEAIRRGLSPTSSEVQLLGALSASVLAFAVAGAFLSAIYYPHMYVLAGMIIAARRLTRLAVGHVDELTPAPPAMVLHPALRPLPRGRYVS